MTSRALNIPNYEEVVGLSNGDLMNRMKDITGEIDQLRVQGESTTELAYIYKVYEEEWFKRLAFAWHPHRS